MLEEDNGEEIGGLLESQRELGKKRPAMNLNLGLNDGSSDDLSAQEGARNRYDGLEGDGDDEAESTDLIPKVIDKLWSQLGKPGDHAQIVELLKQFDDLKPDIFSDVIKSDLAS